MIQFYQGDVIKIRGFGRHLFVIVSNNAFIRATGVFHVCPLFEQMKEGPVHISVRGDAGTAGTVLCEQVKMIDPGARACSRIDHLPYADIMEVSDVIQGIFEYD